jgi:hypothetical protein
MKKNTENRPTVNLIPLQDAVLCADCELISEGANGHCAGCGSQATISLSKVMGTTAAAGREAASSAAYERAEVPQKVKRLSPQVA